MYKDVLIQLEKLNKLELTEAEREQIGGFITFADSEAQCLKSCPTDGVKPMPSLSELVNVFRKDVMEKNFPREDLQKDAPEHMDGYWQVPRLLD